MSESNTKAFSTYLMNFYYNLNLIFTILVSLPLPLKALYRTLLLVTYSIPPKHFCLKESPASCSSDELLQILSHFKAELYLEIFFCSERIYKYKMFYLKVCSSALFSSILFCHFCSSSSTSALACSNCLISNLQRYKEI